MPSEKRTCSNAGNKEDRKMNIAIDPDYIAEPSMIASMLSRGAENGLHLSELAELFGTDKRTLRAQIERERRAGAPILSDNKNGYFLPEAVDDIHRFVRSMRGRANEILTTAQAVENRTAKL